MPIKEPKQDDTFINTVLEANDNSALISKADELLEHGYIDSFISPNFCMNSDINDLSAVNDISFSDEKSIENKNEELDCKLEKNEYLNGKAGGSSVNNNYDEINEDCFSEFSNIDFDSDNDNLSVEMNKDLSRKIERKLTPEKNDNNYKDDNFRNDKPVIERQTNKNLNKLEKDIKKKKEISMSNEKEEQRIIRGAVLQKSESLLKDDSIIKVREYGSNRSAANKPFIPPYKDSRTAHDLNNEKSKNIQKSVNKTGIDRKYPAANNINQGLNKNVVDGWEMNLADNSIKDIKLDNKSINSKKHIQYNNKVDKDYLNSNGVKEEIINYDRVGLYSNPLSLYENPGGIAENSLLANRVEWVLNNIFHLSSFRNLQKAAIMCILEKKDVFVLMPTGGGKSLCFQLPALIETGVTIVISPLLSLIRDQISHLLDNGILALPLNSTVSSAEKELFVNCMVSGIVKIFYVTPEMLVNNQQFQEVLKKTNIARVVIDEVHCMSQWGFDFRPDYQKLKWVKQNLNTPITALTATATPIVYKDILKSLRFEPVLFKNSFNRPNLKYSVKMRDSNTENEIISFINCYYPSKTGIIYCLSKKDTESLCELLNERGVNAVYYHAGLSKGERSSVQDIFTKQAVVLCATIAFGMGIDKKDVRFVIHYALPKSLEGYYQETGRGGRDGLESICILYYSYRDKSIIEFMNRHNQNYNKEDLKKVIEYCSSTECRRKILLSHFGEVLNKCEGCDNCNTGLTDCTSIVNLIYECCKELSNKVDVSLSLLVKVIRGSKGKEIEGYFNCRYYGCCKDYGKVMIDRIVKDMVMRKVLLEAKKSKGQYRWTYIKLGKWDKSEYFIRE